MGYQNNNQALITPWLGDSRINEVKSQLGAVYGKDIDVLFIHETHAYLTHHNKGRYVKPCDVVAWIFENNPNELEDIIVPLKSIYITRMHGMIYVNYLKTCGRGVSW